MRHGSRTDDLAQGSRGQTSPPRSGKGTVAKLYIAQDADPALLQPLVQKSVDAGVRVEQIASMKELGEACGIAVGAAVAALLQ